jgi:DNA-directed RNA polymerase beta' subunit
MSIPSTLQSAFRIATTRDIRSWSFGALTAKRHTSATFHDNVKGTLHDQRIFGPIRDFKCACGKYSGESHANMICDMCGVKVAPNSTRSTRFGHIEFTTDVQHPFDSETVLSCFPVLPADFIQSSGGQRLQALFDQLIESNMNGNHDHVVETTTEIVEWLTPVVVTLHNWNVFPARNTLARGIALEPRA